MKKQQPKTIFRTENLTPIMIKNLHGDADMLISDKGITGLRVRYSRLTGRKNYYALVRIISTNKQREIKIGSTTEYTLEEARQKTIELKKMAREGNDPVFEVRDRVKKRAEEESRKKKLKDLAPIFLEKHSKINNRKSTYKGYEGMFRIHILPLLGNKIVWDLDLADLQDAYDKIKTKHNKPHLCDHFTRLLSSFLNWCEKYNYRPLNSCPTRHITKMRIPRYKPTLLDLDGYQRLFAALDDALRREIFSPFPILALKTLALTGCRSKEIKELEREELDFDKGFLRLLKRKTDTFDVPLGNPAIEIIKQALALSRSKRWVFPSPHDSNNPVSDLRRPFFWALEKAGLPQMRIHDLRHSFASMGVDLGEDIRTLKDVLGHTKITTTEIYAHTTNRAARMSANNVAGAIAQVVGDPTLTPPPPPPATPTHGKIIQFPQRKVANG